MMLNNNKKVKPNDMENTEKTMNIIEEKGGSSSVMKFRYKTRSAYGFWIIYVVVCAAMAFCCFAAKENPGIIDLPFSGLLFRCIGIALLCPILFSYWLFSFIYVDRFGLTCKCCGLTLWKCDWTDITKMEDTVSNFTKVIALTYVTKKKEREKTTTVYIERTRRIAKLFQDRAQRDGTMR